MRTCAPETMGLAMGNYAGLVVDGGSSFDSLGASISGIGDFNGDGIDDFIVGASSARDAGDYQFNGSAYIIFGTVDGPATLNVDELDGTNGFRITPENATGDGLRPIGDGIYVYGSYIYDFGSFVAGIGDINGDGLADVAVAGRTTYYYNFNQDPLERANSIFVIFGTAAAQPAEISVASLDGTNGFQVFGTGGLLNGIEAAGDVNDDGVDDFLISQSPVPNGERGFIGVASMIDSGEAIGAFSIGPEAEDKGAAGYVIFGDSALGGGGASSDAGMFRIDDLDGYNGFEILASRSTTGYYGEIGFYGNEFRSFTTAVGDVNGDGFADIAVRTLVETNAVTPVYDDQGNFQYNNYETTQEGRLHIVLGRPAPDSNGDGRPESVDTTFYDYDTGGEDGVVEVFWGPASGFYYGSQSLYENVNVRGVGDINGDGFADVAVSQPNINRIYGEDRSVGYVDVFFGSADGPQPEAGPGLSIVKFDNTLDYLGQAIAGIGDVNGDGVDDFAISAPRTSFLETVADGVFIVFGSTDGPTRIDLDQIGQPGGDSLGYRIFSSDSTFFNRSAFGEVLSAAGDVNGDGFADLLIGAQYADVDTVAFGGSNAGRAFVVYGGPDALEAADNADGVNDNVIDIANIVVDVDTGVVPIVVSVANAGLVGVSRSEGNAGETIFAFEVRRTGDLTEAVSFDFAVTALDSSINGADFAGGVLPTGPASFASGSATTFVEIAVQGDVDIESSEVFAFTISNPVSETSPISIGAAQTLGRIVNDDFPIRFFAQDASVFEGNPGDDNVLTFTVLRTGPGFAASVDFTVTGDSIFPVNAADFEPGEFPLSGTLDFAEGEFSKTISLRVAEDFDIESSERALLTLSNARSDDALVVISDGAAIGTVRNDDFAPEIFISGNTFVLEGNPGSDRGFNFTIERRGDLNGPVEISYVIDPSPAAGDFFAADAADLEAGLPQGPFTVTIPDGEASVSFRVNIAEDFAIEPRESFSVTIVSVDRPEGGVIYDVIRPSIVATILNDDGRPPVIPPGVEADVFGDPHIVTLDGLGYDFQAVGEYILVETLPGAANPFQVQVRFEPLPGSDLVSVTTRMAVKIGDITVEIDATGPELLLVDGEGLTDSLFALGALDADGDGEPDIFFDEPSGMIFIVLNGADEQLALKAMDGTLNICVFLSSEEGGNAGNVGGLMGDGDSDGTEDDLALRDGTPLTQPVDFDVIYGDYAASWRLDGSDGKAPLFSNAVTFPENFPAAVITLDDLPVELREAAEAAALAAGLDPENTAVFEGAVLDFALTGNPNFIQGATGLVAETMATTDPANAPALPAVVGVSVADPNEDFVEGDEGEQSAVFTFYRIGDASGALTVSYAIGGDVDAADLGAGQTLSGEVTFAEGETSVSILVAVAGDLMSEDDEALTVSITGLSDETALIAGPSATKTILTDDFAPEAADDVFTTTEDARVAGNLLAPNRETADIDADGDPLAVVSVTSSSGVERAVNAATGTGLFILASGAHLRVNADGSFTYDPFGFGFSGASSLTDFDRLDDGEIGVETFTYIVADGNGGFDEAAVTITVNGVNDAPIAVIDSINVTEDDAQGGVNLLNGNIGPDVDPEGGPLAITQISVNGQSVAIDPLSGGTLTLASGASITVLADGTATFFTNGAFEDLGDQPGQIVQRNINFTYTVADEKGLTDTALLQVFVAGVNDAPEIDPIEAAFLADDEGRAIDLLEGAFDAEDDDLSVEDISVEGPGGLPLAFDFDQETGVLTLGDGQFGGLAEGETATVVVSYVVSDGAAETPNSATITITGVAAPNSPPVAVDDDYTTGFGDDLNIGAGEGLLANDSDPDFDALSVIGFQQAANGELAVFPDGSFTYTPDAGFSGTETILYTISDGFAVATATLTIEVAGEEDRPFIFGTDGSDRLVSPNTGAIIDGGAGRDVFIAGAGADTFILSDGDGDQFRRFDASMDKLDISAWGAESFDELVIFDRPGGPNNSGLLITIFHEESRNTAYHFEFGDRLSAADFTAENFIFSDPLNLA